MYRFTLNTGFRRSLAAGVGLFFLAGVTPFWAQAPADNPEPVAPPSAQQQQQPLSPQQLDDLVAPVALYPDPLLGQSLAASTYPLEIVEAQQWLQANRNLSGTALTAAARQQNWDASVQALVAFPDAMRTLSQNMQWTTALGNAFLAQQADVMAAVQRMRQRAQANGRLQSGPQETVTDQAQGGQQEIAIQPTDPNIMYVPNYDPNYVWGPAAYGYYPPLYYPSYGWGWGPGIDIGFCFGPWAGLGWGWGGWGWGFNWFGGGLFVNGGWFNHFGFHSGFGVGFAGRGLWAHDAAHRLGVAYPNARLNARFGAASTAGRMNAARAGFSAPRAAGGGAAGGWSRFGSPGTTPAARNGASNFAGSRGSYETNRGAQAQSYRGNEGAQGYRNSGAEQRSAPQAQRSSQGFNAPRSSFNENRSSFSSGSANRSYSAPSRSSGGGVGGGFHPSGGGGGGSHVGGGGSHGGGGGHRR